MDWFTLCSLHAGIINAALCDGSVDAMRTGSAGGVFHAATGKQDGAVYDPSELTN